MTAQTIIIGLLAAFFIFASSIKILGWQKMIFETQLEMFKKYGFDRQFMAMVGFIELFGAIAICFSGTLLGMVGALAIVGTSAGAIFFHLVYDTWKDGIAAMITLSLSIILVWMNRALLFAVIESKNLT